MLPGLVHLLCTKLRDYIKVKQRSIRRATILDWRDKQLRRLGQWGGHPVASMPVLELALWLRPQTGKRTKFVSLKVLRFTTA